MKVEGTCHCGDIAYEADVEPNTINVCHCADCQMLTGSAFRANISSSAGTFRMMKGEPRRYIKTANSGAQRIHAFCPTCGTPVYSCALESPQTYTLRVGTLKQRYELGTPQRQIWTRRRLPWVASLQGVPEIEGQPG
jgi:hypothetical protein